MRFALTVVTAIGLMSAGAHGAAQEPSPAGGDETGSPTPATNTALNPAVLKVNGEPIYAFEISMVMQTIQNQLDERGETVDQRELAKVATQRAIEQKLLVQEARRFGIKADELEVAKAAQMAEEQSGGRTMLEAKLKNTGSSYDQFLDVIREIEMMKLFIRNQIQPNVIVTDEDVAAYYEANPTLFDAEERVHAYHIIFPVGEDAPAAALEAARKKAEAARERCTAGVEDFAAIARELSEGPSAPTGGDLGWVTRDQLVGPLSNAVFSLQPGEISPVVQSRFGFHVATITDRRPAERISLEEASDQVEAFLRRQRTTEAVGELLETLLDAAKVENLLSGGVVMHPGDGGP